MGQDQSAEVLNSPEKDSQLGFHILKVNPDLIKAN